MSCKTSYNILFLGFPLTQGKSRAYINNLCNELGHKNHPLGSYAGKSELLIMASLSLALACEHNNSDSRVGVNSSGGRPMGKGRGKEIGGSEGGEKGRKEKEQSSQKMGNERWLPKVNSSRVPVPVSDTFHVASSVAHLPSGVGPAREPGAGWECLSGRTAARLAVGRLQEGVMGRETGRLHFPGRHASQLEP